MPTEEGPTRKMLRSMSPTWMLREWGEKFTIGLLGYTGDAMLEAATLAVKAPWLLEASSPDDAVEFQAEETGIQRYPGETLAAHRARVQSPWDAWTFAGTKDGHGGSGQGLEGQLELLGYPNAYTLANYEFSIDGDAANWSRFVVIIPQSDHSFGDPDTWGTVGRTWGDGGVWGSDATSDQIRALRRLIRQWKAGHETCPVILAMRDGYIWGGPGLTWGQASLTWGSGDPPIRISPR